jgi:hypothetical protein
MGRHRRYRVLKSDPTREHLMKKLSRWKYVDGVNLNKFYSVLVKNPRYVELDVEELYQATRQYVSGIKGFVDFVPSFEEFTRMVLAEELFDPAKTAFFDYLKKRRLLYPLGRCWIYRTMIEDIRDNGIKVALKVKNGRIDDGYHRLIVLRELGIKRVVCRAT